MSAKQTIHTLSCREHSTWHSLVHMLKSANMAAVNRHALDNNEWVQRHIQDVPDVQVSIWFAFGIPRKYCFKNEGQNVSCCLGLLDTWA